MSDALDASLCSISDWVRSKDISPVELTRLSLERIAADEPRLGAYVCITAERALAAARQAEREILAGNLRGPLHGVPVAVKDLYDIKGLPTTCSSSVRHDHVATANSACVDRLEQAGAVIVGKTHTHEFAYGIATPTTGNPWNAAHIPGGSSGGSGASVAARGCFMALGSDTGGSIRIPAALCGTVGLKPTFGRVSRFGVASLSWSLDHTGPLTRTVADAAVALAALAGHDPRDPGSADVPAGDYLGELEQGVKGLRIGIPRNYFFDRIDPEVEHQVREAISCIEAEGAELVEIDIPMPEKIMAVEFGLCMPEASAYHHETLRTRREMYGEDVRTFLEAGALIPAVDYIAAMRVRTLMQAAWRLMFEGLDAVMAPAVPAFATRRDQPAIEWPDGTVEPVTPAFVRLSAPANITGLPSVAVPCGFGSDGLPGSFQVIGRPFQEGLILRIARAYERVTDWTTRSPR